MMPLRYNISPGEGGASKLVAHSRPAPNSNAPQAFVQRRWVVPIAGLALFHVLTVLQGREESLWLPGFGLGLVLHVWFGWQATALLVLDLLAIRTFGDFPLYRIILDPLFFGVEIAFSWWLYRDVAKGSERLEDPRSATLFMILVTGAVCGGGAAVHAWLYNLFAAEALPWFSLAGTIWISHALGLLVIFPMLLVVVTPRITEWKLLKPQIASTPFEPRAMTWGDVIETFGLAIGNGILAFALVRSQIDWGFPSWPLWGVSLLLVVWTGLRQGLPGGSIVTAIGGTVALILAAYLGVSAAGLSPFQGNLLAQGTVALLVGASSGWIRASEARYRQVVGHIPVVLYSAHIPGGIHLHFSPDAPHRPDSKLDMGHGPDIANSALVTLVSPASLPILGASPHELEGPYQSWLNRILPEDRDIVIASLSQLCLQKQPVVCEYRLVPGTPIPAVESNGRSLPHAPVTRWVRDTLAPHYEVNNILDGWEGVVEDITEARALAQNLRRTSNMFQALISNLPTGVFFVQGPTGAPILANTRARQLLGQREDLAAGFAHLPRVYRMHKPDGSEYPAEDLPVSKALKLGTNQMANDIVIHRPDGRRVPLITWAAPIDLTGNGKPDAAVWVLEDWSALQHAEMARRDTEMRLRAVIETMAEGVLVQNQAGQILESNPSACNILGMKPADLAGRTGLGPEVGCFNDDGSPLARDDHPDRRIALTHEPVRNFVMGVPVADAAGDMTTRWILVNAIPLPVGPRMGAAGKDARIVTTFADVTPYRQALRDVKADKERFQTLLETLPLMVMQFDKEGQVQYVNPAAQKTTGFTAEELRKPGFWEGLVDSADRIDLRTALSRASVGYHARVEFKFQGQDGSLKVGLGLAQPLRQECVLIGCTFLVIDMTLQRRLEKELQRTQQIELVGRLAGGTVHDFNNLLTIMLGMAGIAHAGLEANHPQRETIKRIMDVGAQASHLAGQLLAFSKQRKPVIQVLDLNYVVILTVKLLETVMPPNIRVISQVGHESLPVKADENQLKQVLMNLCLNARDAMAEGGKLTVRTETMKDDDGSSWVKLSVEDTGQGMDGATLKRIFEPFFSTKERGTGLGLAVVKQIVEDAGGRVEAKSEIGSGTRMEIWLPAA